jgi:hypothetical protein
VKIPSTEGTELDLYGSTRSQFEAEENRGRTIFELDHVTMHAGEHVDFGNRACDASIHHWRRIHNNTLTHAKYRVSKCLHIGKSEPPGMRYAASVPVFCMESNKLACGP